MDAAKLLDAVGRPLVQPCPGGGDITGRFMRRSGAKALALARNLGHVDAAAADQAQPGRVRPLGDHRVQVLAVYVVQLELLATLVLEHKVLCQPLQTLVLCFTLRFTHNMEFFRGCTLYFSGN